MEKTFKKVLKIEGMSCSHCVQHVTKALMEIDGVSAVTVSLDSKTADVVMSKEIDESVFTSVIDEAGFELVR